MDNDINDLSQNAEKSAKYLRLYKEKGIRAQAYLADIQARTIDLMLLLSEVRDLLGKERPFHEWCKEYLGWSENSANVGLRIGRWLTQVQSGAPAFLGELPPYLSKLDELRRIPLNLLQEFKEKHPQCFGFMSTEREDIRARVIAFLVEKRLMKAKPDEAQPDFFQKLGLPAPDKLDMLITIHRKSLSPDAARFYGTTFLNEAVERCSEMQDDELKVLIQDLQDLLEKATHGTSIPQTK